MTAVVLVIVLVTKFLAGAWIAILAMGTFFMLMKGDPPALRQRRPRSCAIEADDQVLPTRVHAIVLVSKVHKPTMRALAYAKATPAQRARGGAGRRPTRATHGPDARGVGRAAASTSR